MKKMLSILIAALFLFNYHIIAFADTTVHLPGFSISIPDDRILVTQGTSREDPCWEETGLDYDSFISFMKENSMYIDAMSIDFETEIIVTTVTGSAETQLFDYNLYSDKELQEFHDMLSETYESNGMDLQPGKYTYISPAKYYDYRLHQVQNGVDVYSEIYTTIFNGRRINVTYHSYGKALSDADGNTLKAVVSSIVFNSIETPSGSTVADRVRSQEKTNISDIAYKALVAGLSAAIVAIPAYIIKAVKRKKTVDSSETDDTEVDKAPEEKIEPIVERALMEEVPQPDTQREVNCANCGALIDFNAKYCHKCGTKVSVPIKLSFCRYCGGKLDEDSLFCKHCGKKL